ncbi:MAG: sugar phosphate nucleotidyltransferase [Chthonomonadales bacterium]
MTVKKAVVLAAGRGTRLGELTANNPKGLVQVAGRPMLDHVLMNMQDAGVTETMLIVGYRGHQIVDYYGTSSFGMSMAYATQPVPNGTASALLLAEEFSGNDDIFIIYGDILTSPGSNHSIAETFQSRSCDGVIGLNWVEDPYEGGAVYRENEQVTRVVEKPPLGTSTTNWNIAGVSIFSPAIWSRLHDVSPSPRGEYELTSAIEAMIDEKCVLLGHEIVGFWSDAGTPGRLAESDAWFREHQLVN